MATQDEIAALRLRVDEPTQDPYTDAALSTRLDADGNPDKTAAAIWSEKAARYSRLVSVSESGSSRSMSDLHKNALTMARYYDALVTPVVQTSDRPRTRTIERL